MVPLGPAVPAAVSIPASMHILDGMSIPTGILIPHGMLARMETTDRSPARLTRDERRAQTRERLLDAAAEVFNRLGYHRASLEAVAEAAGFTKGAVYSNFATKGELFTALLSRYTDQRLAIQAGILEKASLEQLADYAGEMIRQQAAEESSWDLLQIEFWLAAMRDPRLRELLVEGSDDLYRQSGQRLEAKLAEAGVRSTFTGVELARLFNALGSGLLLQLYLDPDAVDPELFGRAIRLLTGLPVSPRDMPDAADASGRAGGQGAD